MKKILVYIGIILFSVYSILCGFLYLYQEKIIFLPEKLSKDFTYQFKVPFEDLTFEMKDGTLLNGVLFKAEKSRGLLFYIHGNGGSINSWAHISKYYTDLGYDLLLLDFRGYGKSEGEISSEEQLFQDNQTVYDLFKPKYGEKNIVILGYSVGTGLAAKLAADNEPKMVILQAPYYNLTKIMQENFSFIPAFILKYKFSTSDYLKKCSAPVILFHGTNDEVIPFENSVELQKEFKKGDTLIPLEGEVHHLITDNLEYQGALQKILSK